MKRTLLGAALAVTAALGPIAPGQAAPQRLNDSLVAAEGAVRRDDFVSFFDHYAQSPAVRAAYSAASVSVVTASGTGGQWAEDTQRVRGAQFRGFPVALLDRGYVYAPTAFRGGRINQRPDQLHVEFSRVGANGWSVEWEQVRYSSSPSEAHDERGTIVARYGDSGTLFFQRVRDGWVLTSSRVFKHGRGERR